MQCERSGDWTATTLCDCPQFFSARAIEEANPLSTMSIETEEGDVLSSVPFVCGLDLSEAFARECVLPTVRRELPESHIALARLGKGSEVLGFDTPLSRDHDWGPASRVLLLVPPDADADHLLRVLDEEMPLTFRQHPTRLQALGDAIDGVVVPVRCRFPLPSCDLTIVRPPQPATPEEGSALGLEISSFDAFVTRYFGFDVTLDEWTDHHWLATPQQLLCAFVAGRVFVDDSGRLTQARESLAFFPHRVWLTIMRAEWSNVAQLHAFVGRTGSTSDSLGCALVCAELVQSLMRLAFLINGRYAPYAKWFGRAFRDLPLACALGQHLERALDAGASWKSREAALCAAYEVLHRAHNELGITEPVDERVQRFHQRPFFVSRAEDIAARLADKVGAHTKHSVDSMTTHTDVHNLSAAKRLALIRLANSE